MARSKRRHAWKQTSSSRIGALSYKHTTHCVFQSHHSFERTDPPGTLVYVDLSQVPIIASKRATITEIFLQSADRRSASDKLHIHEYAVSTGINPDLLNATTV
jgi:hypothetical protein